MTTARLAAPKKSLHAAERDTERVQRLRQEFVEAVQPEDVTRFKFVDETSVNFTYTRRYGRATGGQRVDAAVPLRNGPNVTVVAALSAQGVEAVMALDGALNRARFAGYLDQVFGPGLQPGDVLVLDNLPGHKAAGLAERVEARGARLLYLPPNLPDFTPIELAFSKLKTYLRTPAARTREALTSALQAALAWITAQDAQNWFDHCGYHVH